MSTRKNSREKSKMRPMNDASLKVQVCLKTRLLSTGYFFFIMMKEEFKLRIR